MDTALQKAVNPQLVTALVLYCQHYTSDSFWANVMRCLQHGCVHVTPTAFVMWAPYEDGVFVFACVGDVKECVRATHAHAPGEYLYFRRNRRPEVMKRLPRVRFCNMLLCNS